MEDTIRCGQELFGQMTTLNKLAGDLYYDYSRRFQFLHKPRFFIKKWFWKKESEAEEKFWELPLTKKLFKIWIEHIHGTKSGVRVDAQEKTEFIEYLLEKLKIAKDPANAGVSENFQNLAFSLKMLRPNNQAHMYISFSFVMRPLKNFIREYFDMAVITGDYDLLLKRFPPYHTMIKINASPGERTAFDSRGLDFQPVTFRLDTKFTVGLEIERVRVRSNDRYVTCPVIPDPRAEREKTDLIAKMEEDIKSIFKKPDYINNIEFGKDGKVYYLGGEKKEEIPRYGMRRSAYIQKKDELEFLKAIPCPSGESGLVLRFALMHPVRALLRGFGGQRPITLDDVIAVWKCIESHKHRLETEGTADMDDTINELFETAYPAGVSDETRICIEKIEELCREDRTEKSAWRFLTDRFMEGKDKELLQAICSRLTPECFDVFFSLFPLFTGVELTKTETGEMEQPKTRKKVPLLDYLKRELDDLLKQVFSNHIDFSAATNRKSSEARLAGMIVGHCVNVESDLEAFRERLRKHLIVHYKILYTFWADFRGKPGNWFDRDGELSPEILRQINDDAVGILELTEHAQKRLRSMSKSNRLLCFIDPESVVVQTNKFVFEGKGLDLERDYVKLKKKDEADRKTKSLTYQIFQRKLEMEMAEANRELRDLKKNAINSLKDGDVKQYASVALLNALSVGGMKEIERIFRESPEILWALDPDKYRAKKSFDFREELLKHLENSGGVDSEKMRMLLREDYENPVDIEMYREFMKTITDIFKRRII